ncbi:hypothetical protein CHUAL_001288 [Chamberlinius hualienensis]
MVRGVSCESDEWNWELEQRYTGDQFCRGRVVQGTYRAMSNCWFPLVEGSIAKGRDVEGQIMLLNIEDWKPELDSIALVSEWDEETIWKLPVVVNLSRKRKQTYGIIFLCNV